MKNVLIYLNHIIKTHYYFIKVMVPYFGNSDMPKKKDGIIMGNSKELVGFPVFVFGM